MGSKRHRSNKKVQEEEQKGFEALQGQCTPEWWHKMDEHQAKYASAIDHFKITMVDDRAGTAKTSIAVTKALELLKKGAINKIHYVRFPDRRAGKLGFLPGEKDDKEGGFMHPFYEAMEECGIQREFVELMKAHDLIELSTDIFLRGRTLDRVCLIVDEAQNGDISDLRLVLTRIKDNGKGIVIGHSKQLDNERVKRFGQAGFIPFEVYQLHMVKQPWATRCRLYKDYRGVVSQWADEIDTTIKELESE